MRSSKSRRRDAKVRSVASTVGRRAVLPASTLGSHAVFRLWLEPLEGRHAVALPGRRSTRPRRPIGPPAGVPHLGRCGTLLRRRGRRRAVACLANLRGGAIDGLLRRRRLPSSQARAGSPKMVRPGRRCRPGRCATIRRRTIAGRPANASAAQPRRNSPAPATARNRVSRPATPCRAWRTRPCRGCGPSRSYAGETHPRR